MGYLQIRWDSQMQNILLLGTWHLHPHHQGHKGVGHVHLGALGNHLQGYMGYLQIFLDSLMQNLLLGWTWHPHHQQQGPWSRLCASWGPRGHLGGQMGYQLKFF